MNCQIFARYLPSCCWLVADVLPNICWLFCRFIAKCFCQTQISEMVKCEVWLFNCLWKWQTFCCSSPGALRVVGKLVISSFQWYKVWYYRQNYCRYFDPNLLLYLQSFLYNFIVKILQNKKQQKCFNTLNSVTADDVPNRKLSRSSNMWPTWLRSIFNVGFHGDHIWMFHLSSAGAHYVFTPSCHRRRRRRRRRRWRRINVRSCSFRVSVYIWYMCIYIIHKDILVNVTAFCSRTKLSMKARAEGRQQIKSFVCFSARSFKPP